MTGSIRGPIRYDFGRAAIFILCMGLTFAGCSCSCGAPPTVPPPGNANTDGGTAPCSTGRLV